MSARLTIALAAALSLADLSVVSSKTPTLDYEFFKTEVEPIFLKSARVTPAAMSAIRKATTPFG
jgi:hypothetical protein